MNETDVPAPFAYAFRRIDPSRNMARFYLLSLQPTLFGEIAVERHWGRIGTRGRTASRLYGSIEKAAEALERLARAKKRRGYRAAADLPDPA